MSELLEKGTIDKKSSGETKARQGSSSRNYDVLGRELFTPEQKAEVKKALAAGVPKATILTYFYPEIFVEKMSSYRKKQ